MEGAKIINKKLKIDKSRLSSSLQYQALVPSYEAGFKFYEPSNHNQATTA